MKQIKILAIGNSFSQDATRYLAKIAQADHVPLKVVNLYIGGCSLEQHFRYFRAEAPKYSFEMNGESTGLSVTLQQGLSCDVWDFITIQQASHFSPIPDTYEPYGTELAAGIRYFQPNAKLLVHQTWAYEQGSDRLTNMMQYDDQAQMFRDLERLYAKLAKDVHAAGILPSGQLFQRMLKDGFPRVHRDTFHADAGFGRYALAALWYDLITGHSIVGNTFRDLDVPSDGVDFDKIQSIVHTLADEYRF